MSINFYNDFIKNGIPDTWKDSEAMQNSFSFRDKNWKVPITHKTTEFGIGVFVNENVEQGTILRVGVDKENVIIVKNLDWVPNVIKRSENTVQRNRTLEFISNYIYGWSYPDGIVETYLWLPGCSINHRKNGANISFIRTKRGVDLFATKNLEAGEELLADYNSFGPPASWLVDFLVSSGVKKLCWKGYNDFVE